MRGIPHGGAVLVLALLTLVALAGGAAAAPDDPLTNATATPTSDTSDVTVDESLSDTGDSTHETLGDAGSTTHDTLGDAGETTDETLGEAGETVTSDLDGDAVGDTELTESSIGTISDLGAGTTRLLEGVGTNFTDSTESAGENVTHGAERIGEALAAEASLDASGTVPAPLAPSVGDHGTADAIDWGSGDAAVGSLAAPTDAQTPHVAAMNAAGGTRLPGVPEPVAVGATAVVGVSAVAAGTMLGGGTGIERGVSSHLARRLERLVRMVAPFRYSQYDGSDPLEHEDRAAIHDYVAEQPGAYMSAVSETLDIPHSTARHHIRVLEREGLVENTKVRGRRRLFPAHSQQQELAAAMADEATAEMLQAIARLGPCSGSALAEEVDRSVSTVSHHLSRLEDDGLVVREKEGRATVNKLPTDVQDALAPEREAAERDAPAVSAD